MSCEQVSFSNLIIRYNIYRFTFRLRPNFIEMCKPDAVTLCDADGTTFIDKYVCTAHWKDARISQTSFPSGHSGKILQLLLSHCR
jgi:hypothetical protein